MLTVKMTVKIIQTKKCKQLFEILYHKWEYFFANFDKGILKYKPNISPKKISIAKS